MKKKSNGFTLMEMLTVVVILGCIAAIAIPMFANDISRDSEQAAFAASLKTFAKAADTYRVLHEQYLEDSSSGQLPTGLGNYIDQTKWTAQTPIGGVWDAELDSFGIKSAIGVHFMSGSGTTRDDTYMTQIDKLMDDGNLETGQFRKIDSDRYYYIIAEN